MTIAEMEQNRQKAIEEVTQLNNCVDEALDTVELLELGLKHTAVVYSVNKLINIKITLGYILRALKDTEE